MNVIFEPTNVYSTQRKCSHIDYNGTNSLGCLQPASFWRFHKDEEVLSQTSKPSQEIVEV